MPARDLHHEAVCEALEKDGWTITDDPLYFSVGEVNFFMDLGAERLIAAERGTEKIAVEIKGFTEPSPVNAFHEAVGKFVNYRTALEDTEAERVLFLAVLKMVYEDFFQRPFIQKVVRLEKLKLLIYELKSKTVAQWIK